MSTEFENSKVDIEHLLRSKSWEQLSASEKEEVLKFVPGKEEYERMHIMTTQLMGEIGVQEEELLPSDRTRENLMNAFADEQSKRRAMWWNSLRYRLNDVIRFDIPAVRIAVASVILVLAIVGTVSLFNEESNPVVAKNVPVIPPDSVKGNTTSQDNPVAENNGSNDARENVAGDDSIIDDVIVQFPVLNDTGFSLPQVANLLPFLSDTMVNQNPYNIATSNGVVYTNNSFNTQFNNSQFNNYGNAVVNTGLPERARALESDAQVLDVFFAVK
jgi:hypothetical protein